jgi:hypothetical protein
MNSALQWIVSAGAIAVAIAGLVVARAVDFLLDLFADPFAGGDEFVPVEITPGNHRQISLNRPAKLMRRVPILAEGKTVRLGDIFNRIVECPSCRFQFQLIRVGDRRCGPGSSRGTSARCRHPS